MKKIIDGVLYDTENAQFITGEIYPLRCVELYQTKTGEYFLFTENERETDDIELCSEDFANSIIEYTTEEKIICPPDVWKRKKKVFQEIKNYVEHDLNNPFKGKGYHYLTVTERDGYLRIYNGCVFVCLGLEKGDFILDTDDMNYKDVDLVKEIRDHKDTILSMYYKGIKKEK